ncbi:MAG: hypothetical protein WAU75_03355 [Solirubrobacteraceae bacterium]
MALPRARRERPSLRRRLPGPPPTPGRLYLIVAGAALALATVSLLYPSTPNYDPWAWVIWGREIIHFDLVTSGGPTWKPLPMIFTTLFAPLGGAAPDLWLVIARAGGIMAVAMAFALAFRLTRAAIGPTRSAARSTRQPTAAVLAELPPLLAGTAAAVGVLVLSQYVYDVTLGYSEGLLMCVTLLAILRHLDGNRVQAFAFGFAASLDRPEIWPFLGLYAIYLWRKEPRARKLIVMLLALIVPLWLLPDLVGSGSLLRGVKYALIAKNGVATAHCPFCTEITTVAWPLVITPFKISVALFLVAVPVGLTRALRLGGAAWIRTVVNMVLAHRVVLATVLFGITLFVEDAALTQFGSSGNNRYVFLAASMLIIGGAVAWAGAMIWLGNVLARFSGPALGVVCALLVSVSAFVAVSPTRGSTLIRVGPTLHALRFEAEQRADLPEAVRLAGGVKRLESCGPIATNPSTAPQLAWVLRTPINQLQSLTGHVLVQMAAYQGAGLLPSAPSSQYRLVAQVRTVRILSDCF